MARIPMFLSLVAGMFLAQVFLAGCATSRDSGGGASPAATQSAAVDLHNTVCPVSGEKVGPSKLTETYQGKIYHFCCDSCPEDFRKDPDKYAKAVAADPAKYGVH